MHALSGRPILPVRLQQQRGQRSVRRGQLLCCWKRHHGHLQFLSCWRVLLGWMQLVERKRAVWRGQLLDCRQWCNCGLLCMPLRHLQCDRGVHFCWSLFCLPCWGVLPCRLQLVEWERAVLCGQLLDCRQRYQLVMQRLSRWKILPWGHQQLQWQRSVPCGQLLCYRRWHDGRLQRLPCWGVLPGGMQLINWKRAVWSRQLLYCGQRYERGLYRVSCGHVQRDEWVLGSERVLGVSCGSVLLCRLQLIER